MARALTRRRRKEKWAVTINSDVAQEAATISERLNISKSALVERGLLFLIDRYLKDKEEIEVPAEAHFAARPRHWRGRPARRAGERGRPKWMKKEVV